MIYTFRLLVFSCLLFILSGCHSAPQSSKEDAGITNSGFLITGEEVGLVKKGMSIKDLYDIFPENQIKKIKTKSELTAEAADNYYLYDDRNKLLLILSQEKENDADSKINRIIIKDKRFITEKGIGLSSHVGAIKAAYPQFDFIPAVNEIILFVPEIDGNFEVSTRRLTRGVWNDSTGLVSENIPDSTRVKAFAIFWTPGKSSIITKSYWHDLIHGLVSWSFTELPSILILLALLTALLRLLHIALKRIKKIAVSRAEKAENVDTSEAEKRINTLSGIILGIGKIFLWTIFVLILLGKFNINIAPILASAGIVGLAVGFGAQELVRDFISGFFILLEDQIRTGDVAIINGTTGTVEKIEMRTITLRDSSGVVHIFQNGKINTLSNMTKGWSAIVVEIGVAYKEDTDKVTEVMKQIGSEMQNDPAFSGTLIAPVDVWGIDQFADSSVILKVKLTTKASQQWTVSREYRRRIKKAFDAQHIEMPFPHVSIYTGETTKPMPVQQVKE